MKHGALAKDGGKKVIMIAPPSPMPIAPGKQELHVVHHHVYNSELPGPRGPVGPFVRGPRELAGLMKGLGGLGGPAIIRGDPRPVLVRRPMSAPPMGRIVVAAGPPPKELMAAALRSKMAQAMNRV